MDSLSPRADRGGDGAWRTGYSVTAPQQETAMLMQSPDDSPERFIANVEVARRHISAIDFLRKPMSSAAACPSAS